MVGEASLIVRANRISANNVGGHHNEDDVVGNPVGIVLATKEGPAVYHMGDTEVFGDMALINELHKPDIGIVPIGDRFTMGAAGAAYACMRYFSFKTVFPAHSGTSPFIDPTPDAFIARMQGQNVIVPEPGVPVTV